MRWGRLIGGLLCLVGALAMVVLPADKTMFMVGESNTPLLGAAALALLGLALLIGAVVGRRRPRF